MSPRRTAIASLAAASLVLGTFGVTQAQTSSTKSPSPTKSPSTSSGAGQAAGPTGKGTSGKGGGTSSTGQIKVAAPTGIDALPKKVQDKLNAKRADAKKHHSSSTHPAT